MNTMSNVEPLFPSSLDLMDVIMILLGGPPVNLDIESYDGPVAPNGKVFDWNKAARLIKASNPKTVSAGLKEDPEFSVGYILLNEKPVFDRARGTANFTFLGSDFATPCLCLDGAPLVECWILQKDTVWTPATKWPQSALDILNS